MPGTTREWPAWPEYTNPSVEETKDSDFLSVKKTIIDKYGPDILRQSWIKVCRDLQAVTNEIADKGDCGQGQHHHPHLRNSSSP